MTLEGLLLFAQRMDNDEAAAVMAALGGIICFVSAISLVFFVIVAIGMWKVFEKAGKPGWAAIVPFYNLVVLLEIGGKPVWWIVLILLVPIANLVCAIIMHLEVAKAFGKDTGFGLGLAFLPFIFYPILGFGQARYQGVPQPRY